MHQPARNVFLVDRSRCHRHHQPDLLVCMCHQPLRLRAIHCRPLIVRRLLLPQQQRKLNHYKALTGITQQVQPHPCHSVVHQNDHHPDLNRLKAQRIRRHQPVVASSRRIKRKRRLLHQPLVGKRPEESQVCTLHVGEGFRSSNHLALSKGLEVCAGLTHRHLELCVGLACHLEVPVGLARRHLEVGQMLHYS